VLNRRGSRGKAHLRRGALALGCVAASVSLAACGTQGISVPKSSPYYRGAELFLQHCSGCHTLTAVGAEGSATNVKDRLRTQGPNFNVRKESVENVLYAIRNGGFSGAIMPQNVVVGEEAQEVARFLATYAGSKSPYVPTVEIPPEEPASGAGGTGGAGATGPTGGAAAGGVPSGGTAAPAGHGAHLHAHTK
jgi:mono/diheme cytochrome c family protein